MRPALVVFAACSSTPHATEISNTQVATVGPAPRVERGGRYGLTTAGMPAIAHDGSRIVTAFRESDGARGFPNMTVIVKDRSDAEVAQHVVLSLAEADTMLDDADGKNPQLDERVARANQWLADLHATARFDPMRVLDPEKTAIPFDRTYATGDDFKVAWERSHLRIADGTRVLVDKQTPPMWLPESFKVGTNVCQRSAYLGAAAIDRARSLAVVTISYVGSSDFCLEPADQNHVITW